LSQSVTLNGVSYTIPSRGEQDWDGNVTSYLVAIATGFLSKAGGAFTLTAEADFGATYGLVAAYFKSRTANASTTGVLRLANADSVKWRNGANSADLNLAIASNRLQFEGVDLVDVSSTQTLTNKTLTTPLISAATSTSSNPSSAGVVRFANNEGIGWRNAANNANLELKVTASDALQFNGSTLATAASVISNYVLFFGALSCTTGGAEFLFPGGGVIAANGTEGNCRLKIPLASTLKKVTVINSATPDINIPFAIRKNGSTLETVTLLSGQNNVTSGDLSQAYAAGDLLTVSVNATGASVAPAAINVALHFQA
jgi:hypothetical protein